MLNIGIIGCGKIAHRVAMGIGFSKNAKLYAVGAREIERAVAFQQRYQVEKAYGSYEELVQDEKIDMVYICTPNGYHYEHIHLCLSHHKHVLCEKPLVSNGAQLIDCFAYAKQQMCFLMEAEKTLFTPLNQKIKMMIEEGVIGRIQYIEGSYGYVLEDMPKDFWGYAKEDGGSAYDVGVYPICYANYFAQGKLVDIKSIKQVEGSGYDVFMQALLRYDNGICASVRSAWNMGLKNTAYIYGTKGTIITDNFWKNTSAILAIQDKQIPIEVDMESDFTGEIEHAVAMIEQGLLESPIMSFAASKAIMQVLETIKE